MNHLGNDGLTRNPRRVSIRVENFSFALQAGPLMAEIIFFDAAGTLFELTETVGWHYAAVARKFEQELEVPALDAAFRKAWKRATPPPVTPGTREDNDRGWWRSLVQDVFAQIAAPFREEYFEAVFEHFTEAGVWRLYPETLDVLENLAADVRLGIISNFDSRLYRILENLEIRHFFDPITISSEAGADKPHAQIFEKALQAAGARARDAWHVGDDPEADWQGARASGIQVYELVRPKNNLRGLTAHL